MGARVAIVGAGWAGLAAAVEATLAGHEATVFEASRMLGGRARTVIGRLPDGREVPLDNGQHILIGAYTQTLRLMALVGADAGRALMRLPLALKFAEGEGLELPAWPAPLDALGGILGAHGWRFGDKFSLLTAAAGWQLRRFTCPADMTVARLCAGVSPRILSTLIEPLCVSALNTPSHRASGAVFLRVVRDSLFGPRGSSNLLLPRQGLTAVFPQAAACWLAAQGRPLRMGARVGQLQPHATGLGWHVNGEAFDSVIVATSASNGALLLKEQANFAPESIAVQMLQWSHLAAAMHFEAITTVYAFAPGASLERPMLALRSGTGAIDPAQFAFDRGQLGGPTGLLAFVVSASTGERDAVAHAVLAQARSQLGLELQLVQAIVEKRATFSCTPGLRRPPGFVAPGLLACGDYCAGPYPATLEGAIRSALEAVKSIGAPTVAQG